MSDKSAIEWTDATWNPVTGCTKVSPGCDNCYAETFAERWRGTKGHHYEQGFDLWLWPDRLDIPLRWKRPRKIFVNSMSDLFHKDVPEPFIDRVFATMLAAKRHTYQLLTKRPDRMRRYLSRILEREAQIRHHAIMLRVWDDADSMDDDWRQELAAGVSAAWHNVWLGVSVESADYRWRNDMLRETPAAVRFLSIEPMIGPIEPFVLEGMNWVIVGGESGPGARPMHPDWVRQVRNACADLRIPFFFKQWGGAQKKRAGRMLDGREWNEFPKAIA